MYYQIYLSMKFFMGIYWYDFHFWRKQLFIYHQIPVKKKNRRYVGQNINYVEIT